MSQPDAETAAIAEELQVFLNTIRQSETYQRVLDTQAALEEDDDAMALLEDYREKQQELQATGFDQSVMSELRDLETELSNNDTIQQHRDAQDDLVALLQETNDVISEQIGQEFAQSLGGGCC